MVYIATNLHVDSTRRRAFDMGFCSCKRSTVSCSTDRIVVFVHGMISSDFVKVKGLLYLLKLLT